MNVPRLVRSGLFICCWNIRNLLNSKQDSFLETVRLTVKKIIQFYISAVNRAEKYYFGVTKVSYLLFMIYYYVSYTVQWYQLLHHSVKIDPVVNCGFYFVYHLFVF